MTHRISLPDEDNEFFIQQPDGNFFVTAIGRVIPFEDMPEAIKQVANDHTQYGNHSDCVICRQSKRIVAVGDASGVTAFDPGYFTAADEADRQAEINFARYGG